MGMIMFYMGVLARGSSLPFPINNRFPRIQLPKEQMGSYLHNTVSKHILFGHWDRRVEKF